MRINRFKANYKKLIFILLSCTTRYLKILKAIEIATGKNEAKFLEIKNDSFLNEFKLRFVI
jgi:hypothetical protein